MNRYIDKLSFFLLPWILSGIILLIQLYMNPHHYAAILRVRGDRYAREGDTKNALKAYKTSLQHRRNHYFTWISLGTLREQLGDIKGAISAFAIACNLNPTDAVPQYHLARLLLLSERYDRALEEIKGAFEVAKNQEERRTILVLKAEILEKIEKSNKP